jgi:catechol 2,3-dioxygenase-like lactoylglutathione lyase family enzyme
MFRGIDHVVIAVADLDSAVASYARAGFTVVRGGKHNIGTHNALIAFADGSDLELISFLYPVPGHPWFVALALGGGLVDFCMRTDDLEADVAALRGSGVAIGDPSTMTRERPDRYLLKWVLAIPHPPFNGQVPFLIRDDTPRDQRVPREREHRNGVNGIDSIAVAVEDPAASSRGYARVLGRPGEPVRRPELEANGVSFAVGPNRVELLAPTASPGPLGEWLRARGASPFSVRLRAEHGAARRDFAGILGARLSLV